MRAVLRKFVNALRALMALEVLHLALMLLGRLFRIKRAEIATLAGLGILLPRIKPILAGLESSDHHSLLIQQAGAIRLPFICVDCSAQLLE